jgi:asparagine synthase (glutamine-hydrolysing)
MGAFFIAPTSSSAACERLDQAHRQRGFALATVLSVGAFRFHLYRKLDGQGGLFLETGNDSFACLVGQLVYCGLSGEAALRRYCADLANGRADPDRTIGQFALILKDQQGLRLQTDCFGFFQVYVNEAANIASSSFWSLLELSPRISVDAEGVFEYAWNGATFGGKSFVKEIRRLPACADLTFGENMAVSREATPRPASSGGPARAFDTCVDEHAARLRRLFADLAAAFGDRLHVSFSGGFDSRLVLAGLTSSGLRPDLFVYGRDGDPDVEVAREVATGEKLKLNVVDKRGLADRGEILSPKRHLDDVIAFDAWKVDGIFDDGSDARDRLRRHERGRVPLNGSLGEIYRNFFYIPDRSMSLRDVVLSFFSAYDPAACTGRFRPTEYTASLVTALRAELGCADDRVSRSQVESLYPLVRGRYWTGRDVNLNLRFGRMIFPFMQTQLIAGTSELPISFKNHGRFEGRLIERLDPTIARYRSGYGHPFTAPAPLRQRARSWLTIYRPPWLRRHSYRLRFAVRQAHPWFLSDKNLAQVMDSAMPYMRRYFHLTRVHDPDAFNRVATMEQIFQRYAARE